MRMRQRLNAICDVAIFVTLPKCAANVKRNMDEEDYPLVKNLGIEGKRPPKIRAQLVRTKGPLEGHGDMYNFNRLLCNLCPDFRKINITFNLMFFHPHGASLTNNAKVVYLFDNHDIA